MDNVGASSKPASNAASVAPEVKVTIATQTGIEEADKRFDISKLSTDHHCYECKVKYRDPRPKDLVMFLHAWVYRNSKSYSRLSYCLRFEDYLMRNQPVFHLPKCLC